MLIPLDEYLQDIDVGGEETLEKPHDNPPSIPPDKMKGKSKRERSWK